MADTNIVFRSPNIDLNVGGQHGYESVLFETDTYSRNKDYVYGVRNINDKTITITYEKPAETKQLKYSIHMKLIWDD
jgi:hypothetical protein